MSGTLVTFVGNLAADPEIRFLESGRCVARLRVGSTPRRFDAKTSAWVDGDTVWMTVTAWGAMAEHCSESLHKGDRVIVSGELKQSTFEREGQNHTATEIVADEVGVSLRHAKAVVTRVKAATVEAPGPRSVPVDPWSPSEQLAGTTALVLDGAPF